MTLKKIKLIDEVISGLEKDSTASTLIENMVCVCYAPHLGYRNWIFKYKTLYILLFDEGNGHYQYLSLLTWLDVIEAKIRNKMRSDWKEIK